MKNSIAVTVGLRYRFGDFETGTILKSGGRFYIKASVPKYPLVDLETGETVHYASVDKMQFELLPLGTTFTIKIVNKQKIRVRNMYKRVKKEQPA